MIYGTRDEQRVDDRRTRRVALGQEVGRLGESLGPVGVGDREDDVTDGVVEVSR